MIPHPYHDDYRDVIVGDLRTQPLRLQNVFFDDNQLHIKTAVDIPTRGDEGCGVDVGSRAERNVAQTETNGSVSVAATGVEMQTTRKSPTNGTLSARQGAERILLQ